LQKLLQTFFQIRYEFDRFRVLQNIDEQTVSAAPAYVCVVDGVVLNTAFRQPEYAAVVNGSMFSVCDSSYVPLYIRWIHGLRFSQYSGSELFMDIVRQKKYRMFFLGTSRQTLDGLKENLSQIDERIADMTFYSPPFCAIETFDYQNIAQMIDADGADIIWVALGAPKQEMFMNRLQPFLRRGVMIGVGAAFKFFSGTDTRRAPDWAVKAHLEFVYRIFCEPKKQLKRCGMIIWTLPQMILSEIKKKNKFNTLI